MRYGNPQSSCRFSLAAAARRVAMLSVIGMLVQPLFAPRASHAANPTPASRYRVVVCLRFCDNPRFTPRLVNSVTRQAGDHLANFFGPLADVEVYSHDHWLLDAIGERALDEPTFAKELLADRRTTARFFLFSIDHDNGTYSVSHRQIDGEMSQMGPVQQRLVPDRLWIGKAVSLAVKDDFSPVATVGPHPNSRDKVRLMFHGPRDAISRVLDRPCVLLPLWVLRQGDGGTTWVPVPNTVLRMNQDQAALLDQHEGVTAAFVHSNLANPWRRTSRVLGFQAIKINTRSGQIRVRVLDEQTGAPAVNCIVYANDRGFDFRDADIVGQPDSRGWVSPQQTFQDVAYIRVVQAASEVKLPLPITSDLCETTLEISVDKRAGEKSRLRRELHYLMQDLQTLNSVLNDRFHAVNALNQAKRYEQAMQTVDTTLAMVRSQRQAIADNIGSLQRLAAGMELNSHPLLELSQTQLAGIAGRESSLSELAGNLRDTIEKQNAKSRAEALIKLASDAEQNGDADEALVRYNAALTELPNDQNLKQKIAEVEQAWQIKSPAHQAARDHVYGAWTQADVTQIEARLPQTEQAFGELKTAGDYLSMLKLLSVGSNHLSDLGSLVEQLADRTSDADRAEFEKYSELVRRLAAFQQEVSSHLQTIFDRPDAASPPPGPPAAGPPSRSSPPASQPPTKSPIKQSALDFEEEE